MGDSHEGLQVGEVSSSVRDHATGMQKLSIKLLCLLEGMRAGFPLFSNSLQVFLSLDFGDADFSVSEIPQKADVRYRVAELNIFGFFPGDSQLVGYGIDVLDRVRVLSFGAKSGGGVRKVGEWETHVLVIFVPLVVVISFPFIPDSPPLMRPSFTSADIMPPYLTSPIVTIQMFLFDSKENVVVHPLRDRAHAIRTENLGPCITHDPVTSAT